MDAGKQEPLAVPSSRGELDREAEAWFAHGSYMQFFAYMAQYHQYEIQRFLISKFRLSEEDAQDCYAVATEALFAAAKKGKDVASPIGYVFTATRFNAIDLVQTQKRQRVSTLPGDQLPEDLIGDPSDPDESDDCTPQVDIEWSASMSSTSGFIANQLSLAIVEELDPSVEVEEEWSLVLVREALSYLTPKERQVVELLLVESDFDFEKNQHIYLSPQAEGRLGMTQAAYRKAKSRAFEHLKELIPKIILDLNLQLPRRAEESIFETSWRGPSDDLDV